MYKKRQTKIRETEHFKETTIQIHRTNEQWIGTDDIQISIILCFNINQMLKFESELWVRQDGPH